jgi:hypothetical protein
MKLTSLFLRATRRVSGNRAIEPQARIAAEDLADRRTDRSSMADLVRLLQKFDDARTNALHGK